MLAVVRVRQANRSTVSRIVLLYLLALDENQEVSKPFMYNESGGPRAGVTAEW